ncbi:hypothetical protein N7454_001882 [Penicillium verhagenii]|nr:hypothetical protein N7454_001882 [Penicillium verhagenii]
MSTPLFRIEERPKTEGPNGSEEKKGQKETQPPHKRQGGYFFYPAYTKAAAVLNNNLPHKPLSQWTDDQKAEAQHSFQECFNTLEEYSMQASNTHKMMFAKRARILALQPAALHKARTGIHDEDLFNEFRIAMPEQYGATQTYSQSQRDGALRRSICARGSLRLSSGTRRWRGRPCTGLWLKSGKRACWMRMGRIGLFHRLLLMRMILCIILGLWWSFVSGRGLDKGVVQFEWADQGEMRKSAKWGNNVVGTGAEEVSLHQRAAGVMLSTLENSSGIVRDKAPEDVDIDAEAAKWRVEFGEEIGGLVEEYVRKSMPDYEYLKARRITV